MKSTRARLFAGTAAVSIALDQLTKVIAVNELLRSGVRSVPVPGLGNWFRFTYVENRGAAFGVLQDQTTFFLVIGTVVIGVIIASYRFLPQASPLVHLALGLQLGGAAGNMIDRVRQGYVVDFLDFGYRANWWPVFNLADSSLTAGVALLAVTLLRQPDPQPHPRPGDA